MMSGGSKSYGRICGFFCRNVFFWPGFTEVGPINFAISEEWRFIFREAVLEGTFSFLIIFKKDNLQGVIGKIFK